MSRPRLLLGLILAAGVVGGATAADPIPDRRAVRPSGSASAPAAAPAASLSNEALLELSNQLDTLQAQMRELRGQIEIQRHEIEQLKNREHQSSVDLDKRLRDLERRGTAAADGGNGPVTMVTPPIGGGPTNSANG
ncbi:MAG: YbgF trimerization domain-containing protein, partial [Sulfurifustaceae bacterium]